MVMVASTSQMYGESASPVTPRYERASTGLGRASMGWANYPGVREYLNGIRELPWIQRVRVGALDGAVWIVTDIEGGHESLDSLSPLFEAELVARQRAGQSTPIVFRILDRGLPEEWLDGPDDLVPVR